MNAEGNAGQARLNLQTRSLFCSSEPIAIDLLLNLNMTGPQLIDQKVMVAAEHTLKIQTGLALLVHMIVAATQTVLVKFFTVDLIMFDLHRLLEFF